MTATAGNLRPGHVFSSPRRLRVWVPVAPDSKSEAQATQLHSPVREETKFANGWTLRFSRRSVEIKFG